MSQWLFSNGTMTFTSPEEDIQKEVDRCKGGLNTQLKHIIKSETFVPDPAVANLHSTLANHSTKKYTTAHGRRRDMLKDFMNYWACW
jgi:hypothetical protein